MAISLSRLKAIGVLRQVALWVSTSHAQKKIHTEFGIPADRISVPRVMGTFCTSLGRTDWRAPGTDRIRRSRVAFRRRFEH